MSIYPKYTRVVQHCKKSMSRSKLTRLCEDLWAGCQRRTAFRLTLKSIYATMFRVNSNYRASDPIPFRFRIIVLDELQIRGYGLRSRVHAMRWTHFFALRRISHSYLRAKITGAGISHNNFDSVRDHRANDVAGSMQFNVIDDSLFILL